jgi:ribonuclease P protein component
MCAITSLKKRKDFLVVRNKGGYSSSPSFVIQFYKNDQHQEVRVGYTVTKRIGNAVARNLCKRRLRSVLHNYFKEKGVQLTGIDLVLIAKKNILTENFLLIQKELDKCLPFVFQKCL